MYILILSIFTDCFFKASLVSLAQLPFAPNPRLFSTDFHTICNLFLRCFLRGDSLVMVTNYRVKQLLLSHMSITKLKNTRNAKDDDCCHLVDVKAFFIKKIDGLGLQISRKYQNFIVLGEKWRWQLNGDQKVSEIRAVLSFCLNFIFTLRLASIRND